MLLDQLFPLPFLLPFLQKHLDSLDLWIVIFYQVLDNKIYRVSLGGLEQAAFDEYSCSISYSSANAQKAQYFSYLNILDFHWNIVYLEEKLFNSWIIAHSQPKFEAFH